MDFVLFKRPGHNHLAIQRIGYEHCCTKPALIRRWFGAKRGTIVVCDVDPRVGGKWRYVMRLPNGQDMAMSGEYKELSPPDPSQEIRDTVIRSGMEDGAAESYDMLNAPFIE